MRVSLPSIAHTAHCDVPESELVPEICMHLGTLLANKGLCQTLGEEDDERTHDDDDDIDDHDEVLIDTVVEAVTSIAKLYGGEFGPSLAELMPPLISYCRPSRPNLDRSMGIGAVAELIQAVSEGFVATPALLAQSGMVVEASISCIGSDNEAVRRNAAFCVGCLCLHAGDSTNPHLMPILQALRPLFARAEGVEDSTVDNACGAVARIIVRIGAADCAAALPLGDILPVMLLALPLKEDFAESIVVRLP